MKSIIIFKKSVLAVIIKMHLTNVLEVSNNVLNFQHVRLLTGLCENLITTLASVWI